MTKKTPKFLDYFPDHVYRYIDQTGEGRGPVSSVERKDELNVIGYESYFTVNGFKGRPDAKKDNCTNINAFFIDIDGRKDLEELEAIKKRLDPTFILETKNGHHIYWLLDESIYKDEVDNWDEQLARWEKIEQQIVTDLNADPVVKDVTRIMRIPDTFYWKKSGDAYKSGTEGIFKIKGIYKQPANTYSMDKVAEAFPVKEEVIKTEQEIKAKTYADQEKKDFFDKVNQLYPMNERDSFKKLVSGKPGTLPANINSRNQALLVAVSLMRQAGWDRAKAVSHINEVGWHGIEKERGGAQEIMSTINSGFSGGYTYSHKNEVIAFNMTTDEEVRLQETFMEVLKGRKEKDKIRFSNYENEMLIRHPNLKKNEGGIIFDYIGGVYKIVSDVDISSMILRDLYEDMLWGYRTGRCVADKLKCLISVLPNLEITEDNGKIVNLKNGLLNIETLILSPHTPEFVSLTQLSVAYDTEAQCPVWNDCVSAWMNGDEAQEKTVLLQQFAGYCITSTMQYDRALFLVGDGGNGKSTFVDTIAMVVGEQSTSHIDLEDIAGQFGMYGLVGKKLNIVEEVHGNYYQSNKLKKLISGEPVTINVKYKDPFAFMPTAKFMFAVNIMPRVDDTSTAMERRICAILFKNNFRNSPNTALRSGKGILASELSGIFNWMLEGAKMLRERKGFVVTREQILLLSEYRQENSSVEGFIAECLSFEEGVMTTVRELYDEYKEYCSKDGRKFKGNIGFTKELKAYGVRYSKFSFIERENGRDVARFEGVKVNSGWGAESNVHAMRNF